MNTPLQAYEQALSCAQHPSGANGSYSRATKILGVDPGLYGALALYDPATDALSVLDVPTANLGKGKQKKTVVDEYALARAVDSIASEVAEVWLEAPTPRPGQAVGAVATSLRNYGLLRGVFVANFLRVEDVAPSAWKRALKITGDKDESRLRASAMLPRSAHLWPLKKHDGRAEAALIALYGARKSNIGGGNDDGVLD